MFYAGRLYQDAGDTENANALFDKVVGEHGDTEYRSGPEMQGAIK